MILLSPTKHNWPLPEVLWFFFLYSKMINVSFDGKNNVLADKGIFYYLILEAHYNDHNSFIFIFS